MLQAVDRPGRRLRSAAAGFLCAFLFLGATVQAWQVELVSRAHSSQVSETGAHAWGVIDALPLHRLSMSAEGRYVAFISRATNLVPGQKVSSSGFPGFNVFLRDLVTGTTTLVSRSTSSPATAGRSGSFTIPLAANGTGTFAILPQIAGNGTVHVAVEVSGYIE